MSDDVTRDAEAFASRHIGPSAPEVDAMLATLGMASLDELIDRAVPEAIRDRTPLDLPDGLTEAEAKVWLEGGLAGRNRVMTSLIGQGYSDTVTPAGDPPKHPGEPRPGTPRTRRTSPRSRRAGSRRSSTSRPW